MPREDRLLLICADPHLPEHAPLIEEAAALISGGIEWRPFFKMAAVNGIFAQAYENVGSVLEARGEIRRSSEYEEWKPLYFQTMARNMKLRREAGIALNALSEEGIPFTPIKGYLLKGLYYPQGITRDFDDVDLLFPDRGSRLRAKEVLTSEGFRRLPSGTDAYHIKMAKPTLGMKMQIELHQRVGATTFYSYPLIEDLWKSLSDVKVGEAQIKAMGPEHALLITSLNALRDGVLKLKDLSDLLVLTQGERGFRWGALEPYAQKVGWSHILAFPLTALASYRSAMGLGSTARSFGAGWLSYPIPYGEAHNLLPCRKEPEGLIFAIPEESMDLTKQTAGQAFQSFMSILGLQGRLLLTHVLPDYGCLHAIGCAGEMLSHTVRLVLHEVKMRLPGPRATPDWTE